MALTARDLLGVRDAGLLKGDGLPLATFFSLDARQHNLGLGIFSQVARVKLGQKKYGSAGYSITFVAALAAI